MPTPPDNILHYASPPTRRETLRTVARHCRTPLFSLGILFIIYYALVHGPTSGQVRLDSGDLRYRWFGIPLYYEPMPEPYRSKILSLKSPAVPAQWVTFAENPWLIEHDLTNRYRYDFVASWAEADPNIARLALADLADDIKLTPWCPTKSHLVLSPFVIDLKTEKLPPNWRDLEDVKDYCAIHSYTPTAPIP